MTEGFQNLGQRIVQAARLAVAVHMYESAAQHTSPGGEALRIATRILQQPTIAAGGAGRREAGTDVPRPGDLVTDDERDGLIGRDADPRGEPPER